MDQHTNWKWKYKCFIYTSVSLNVSAGFILVTNGSSLYHLLYYINFINFFVVFTLGHMINIPISGTGKGEFAGQIK